MKNLFGARASVTGYPEKVSPPSGSAGWFCGGSICPGTKQFPLTVRVALHRVTKIDGPLVAFPASPQRYGFAFDKIVLTLPFIFSRTDDSLFFALSVKRAVCATASLIGLYSFASLAKQASFARSFLSTRFAR